MHKFLLLIVLFSVSVSFVQEDGEPALNFVKDMPHFKECAHFPENSERDKCTRDGIGKFISENIIVPDFKKKNRPEGTVFIKFVVNGAGKVTRVEILKGVHPKLDKACVDVVRKLPDFVPGRNLGKPASVIYQMPIRFSW
jgi:TonB family protein